MTDSQSNVIMKRCPHGGHLRPESDFIGTKGQIVKYCKDCRDAEKKCRAKRKNKKPSDGKKLCMYNHYAEIELFEGDNKTCNPCLKKKKETSDLKVSLGKEQAKKEGKRYCRDCKETKEIEEFNNNSSICIKYYTNNKTRLKERYEKNKKGLK